MKKITAFMQLRALAHDLSLTTSGAHWTERPMETAIDITEGLMGRGSILHDGLYPHEHESMARSAMINVLVAGMWQACGRPVVTLGHSTAAACASTRLAEDAADLVIPPWPAFLVRLPVPLLTIREDFGDDTDATLLLVAALPEHRAVRDGREGAFRWWYKLCADVLPRDQAIAREFIQNREFMRLGVGVGVSMWGFNLSTEQMLSGLHGDNAPWQRWDQVEMSSQDGRVDELTKAITLNVCLYAERPNSSLRAVTGSGKGPAAASMSAPRKSKPDEFGSYTAFDLRAGIQLNLSEPLREYIATGHSMPKYRRLVTPHWKRVVHGQGRALRRLQYIEAYWRGGEEAAS